METFLIIVFVAILTLISMTVRHLIYKGVDKIDDKIHNAIDKKKGRMNESGQESLADRFNSGN